MNPVEIGVLVWIVVLGQFVFVNMVAGLMSAADGRREWDRHDMLHATGVVLVIEAAVGVPAFALAWAST